MIANKFGVKELVLHCVHIILVLFLLIDVGLSEYENTWNFYYEQPCCGNSNGHHLRHHKGKYVLAYMMICYYKINYLLFALYAFLSVKR